jgi:hypothetical protein
MERDELARLVWWHLQQDVQVEIGQPCLRIESHLDGQYLARLKSDLAIRVKGDTTLLELSHITGLQSECHRLLAPVDERQGFCHIAAN